MASDLLQNKSQVLKTVTRSYLIWFPANSLTLCTILLPTHLGTLASLVFTRIQVCSHIKSFIYLIPGKLLHQINLMACSFLQESAQIT